MYGAWYLPGTRLMSSSGGVRAAQWLDLIQIDAGDFKK
jgi:hypothetical protein